MSKAYRFTFECRATGMGALTTASGRAYGHSKTGNHWTEEVLAEEGQEIHLTDISNSGHHNCQTYRVLADGSLETIARGNDADCPVCKSRKGVSL